MATSTPITYQITGVVPETQYGPTATPLPGKRVSYKTSTGYEGSVFIPDPVFGDVAAVQQVIEGEIAQVAAVQALSGTVAGT